MIEWSSGVRFVRGSVDGGGLGYLLGSTDHFFGLYTLWQVECELDIVGAVHLSTFGDAVR